MATSQQDLLDLEKKLIERQEKLEAKQESLEKEKVEIEKHRLEYIKKLEGVTHLTTDEAKAQLIKETEKD